MVYYNLFVDKNHGVFYASPCARASAFAFFDSQVWFNTPRQAALARLAAAQMPQRLQ
jgi:hypothetical protein